METGQVITEKNWNFCAVWTRDRREVSVSFKYYKEKLRLGVQNFGWWTNSDSLIFNTAKDYSHKWDGQTLEQCAQYTYRAWSNSRWRWKGTRTQNFSLSLLVITRHPRLWCVLFRRSEQDEIKHCSSAANRTAFSHTEKYYCRLLRRESLIAYLSPSSQFGHKVTEFN